MAQITTTATKAEHVITSGTLTLRVMEESDPASGGQRLSYVTEDWYCRSLRSQLPDLIAALQVLDNALP